MTWHEAFSDRYDAWSADMTADGPFYVGLALEADMRDLVLDERAALIDGRFRALLHLPTWADRRREFERAAASLRSGGRCAW